MERWIDKLNSWQPSWNVRVKDRAVREDEPAVLDGSTLAVHEFELVILHDEVNGTR